MGLPCHWTRDKINETLNLMRLFPLLIPALGIGLMSADVPAHAFFVQTVAAPVAFTTTGNGTLNTTGFRFPPFTNAPASTLVVAQPRFSPAPTITGTVSAGFFVAPSTGNFSGQVKAQPTIYFTSIPIPPFTAAFTGFSVDVASIPSFSCTAGDVCFGTASSFAPYSGTFPPIAANVDPTFRDYVAAGPIVDSFKTSYTFIGSDPDLAFGTSKMKFEGQLLFDYFYVPGPLPIFGVGICFGWSRRLRKRIHHVK
jgi:hypothetical protein